MLHSKLVQQGPRNTIMNDMVSIGRNGDGAEILNVCSPYHPEYSQEITNSIRNLKKTGEST